MYRSAFSLPRHCLDVYCQLHVPAASPAEKELPVPAGGQQSRSGRREEKKILPLPGLKPRPLDRPSHNQ